MSRARINNILHVLTFILIISKSLLLNIILEIYYVIYLYSYLINAISYRIHWDTVRYWICSSVPLETQLKWRLLRLKLSIHKKTVVMSKYDNGKISLTLYGPIIVIDLLIAAFFHTFFQAFASEVLNWFWRHVSL